MVNIMIYSNKLKEIRNKNNLSQEEVSNILNIERGTYSQYETEYIIMPIKHINKICNYFNVSLDYLFSLNNQEQYYNLKKEIDKNISANRLKTFRKENNLTQIKLAQILNSSQSTFADYERGKNIIATPFLYEICKKYNISADYLLGKTNEPKYLK